MALTYDFTKIDNYEEICTRKLVEGDEGFNPNKDLYRTQPLAEALVWMSLFVGMREITEKNWEQFYWRTRLLEVTTGAYRQTGTYDDDGKIIHREEQFFTKDEIKSMIGLSTNASEMTKAEFYKNKIKDLI
tara:strand:+ start:237 stop:629 length:393 start_codon:yes stop_codon:yes gene_type:complete